MVAFCSTTVSYLLFRFKYVVVNLCTFNDDVLLFMAIHLEGFFLHCYYQKPTTHIHSDQFFFCFIRFCNVCFEFTSKKMTYVPSYNSELFLPSQRYTHRVVKGSNMLYPGLLCKYCSWIQFTKLFEILICWFGKSFNAIPYVMWQVYLDKFMCIIFVGTLY